MQGLLLFYKVLLINDIKYQIIILKTAKVHENSKNPSCKRLRVIKALDWFLQHSQRYPEWFRVFLFLKEWLEISILF